MDREILKQLLTVLPEKNIIKEEPMSRHTTFQIGGPADFFVTPGSREELSELLSLLRRESIPYYVIGNGSNLLVGDKGFRGVIIQIGHLLARIQIQPGPKDASRVLAGAGAALSRLSAEAARAGLSGLEFASGIPGTVGGAVAMNAGAYGGEIKDCIESAGVVNKEGVYQTLSREELALGYRKSRVQEEELCVVEAVFILNPGNRDEIEAAMKQLNQKRREKQPLSYPSAGSTFKRPEGSFAGKLIMEAGLSGYRVGDMMVSEKHCGFVINAGNGTAREAAALIRDIQQRVYEAFGIRLEPEVRFIGEF